MQRHSFPWYAVAFLSIDIVVVDLLTKRFVTKKQDIFSGILAIEPHHNFGSIGNIPVPIEIIIIVSAIATLSFLWLAVKEWHRFNLIARIGTACVLAGAIGNTYDRLVFGYVRDWLMFFNRSIINIADASVAIGIVMLIIALHRSQTRLTTPENMQK